MTHDSPEFNERLSRHVAEVEAAIRRLTPAPETRPAVLHEAMRYSLEAGGKRLRPVLCIAAHALFPSVLSPLPAAVALECLHTYSLIHDDLPCMDNADLRRGKPTCHKKFGETTALLAGDALLTHALWLLADAYKAAPAVAVGLVRDLGDAAGSRKLIGGQVEDTIGTAGANTPERLDYIHHNKTAALITAAITMGVRLTSAPSAAVAKAREIGMAAGLAFQVVDDILDVTGDAATLGKPAHADAGNGKLTYPSLHGLGASRGKACELTDTAVRLCGELVNEFGGTTDGFLVALLRNMENRIN